MYNVTLLVKLTTLLLIIIKLINVSFVFSSSFHYNYFFFV